METAVKLLINYPLKQGLKLGHHTPDYKVVGPSN